jgi:hypothetical protein
MEKLRIIIALGKIKETLYFPFDIHEEDQIKKTLKREPNFTITIKKGNKRLWKLERKDNNMILVERWHIGKYNLAHAVSDRFAFVDLKHILKEAYK